MVYLLKAGVTYWRVEGRHARPNPPEACLRHVACSFSDDNSNPDYASVFYETKEEAMLAYKANYLCYTERNRNMIAKMAAEFAAIFPEPPQPTVTRQRAISGPSRRSK